MCVVQGARPRKLDDVKSFYRAQRTCRGDVEVTSCHPPSLLSHAPTWLRWGRWTLARTLKGAFAWGEGEVSWGHGADDRRARRW